MRTTKYFLVKPAVAERAGVIHQRYHTQQGLMVLNEQDMGKIRLEPEEYLTGVVEQVVSEDEAAQLIEQAGRVLGPLVQEQPFTDRTDEEQNPAEKNVDEEGQSESTETEPTDGEQPDVEQSQVEQPEVEQQQAEEGQDNE